MSEWIKRLAEKYSEVNENQSAAMAKKLAKASASSEKGKKAVTLPKAPFEIPESIPANERTAFHGAAAGAHKAGKSHFTFQGKKYPVTMKKDTATAIADDVKEEDEVVMNPKKEKKEKAGQSEVMAQESYSAMNEGSYERAAYGKGDAYERAEAHDEAARDHEVAAKRYEKKQNYRKAEAHQDAAKAHQKAAAAYDKIHMRRANKSGPFTSLPTTKSKAAHAASIAAGSHNESTVPPVYARILESREAHYKKASKPEDWDEKEKNNKGAMDMKKDMAVDTSDKITNYDDKGHDDMEKAGRVGPTAKSRKGDNTAGDKKIIPSATPMKGM